MAFDFEYLGGPINFAGLGQQKIFAYDTADSAATVTGTGYFAECGRGAKPARSRGMEKGDLVIVRYYDSVTTKATFYGTETYEVASVDSDGDITVQGLGSVAVTATADGLTTGLINPGASVVAITSANANNIVTLPAPAPGKRVVGSIAATGCEIRSVTGVTINAVAFPNELALAANSVFYAIGLSATEWHIKTATKAGAWSATDIPDA